MQTKDLTGKPTLMKEVNIGLIKEALAKHQKATRVELSAMTGISQPTVNVLISKLLDNGEVISAGIAESTGGRKAEMFMLNRRQSGIASVIVEIDGFSYRVTDLELQEEEKGKIALASKSSRLKQLYQLIEKILEKNPFVKVLTIGVPGAVSGEGVVFSIPQIAEWEQLHLKQVLEESFSLPVIVMNDINAIVLGYEHSMNEDVQNLVYLHVGSGIGAGIVTDGKLYPGCRSFAGEVGNMLLCDGQTVEEQLKNISGDLEKTVLLEKVLINMICVLNPEMIAIGGEGITGEVFEQICRGTAGYLPEEILPEYTWIESGEEFYFWGLGKLGKEMLNHIIRLV